MIINRCFKQRCFSPSTANNNNNNSVGNNHNHTNQHQSSPSPAHPPPSQSPGLSGNYFSQSPSPTRKLFVTRRSMSPVPCTLRPSSLGLVGSTNAAASTSGSNNSAAAVGSNKRKCILTLHSHLHTCFISLINSTFFKSQILINKILTIHPLYSRCTRIRLNGRI